MEVQITLKNYRCFPDSNPARIKLRNGFTSLIGVNNSGKSSILKFFYEFRQLFQSLSDLNILSKALSQPIPNLSLPKDILDFEELFYNRSNRSIQLIFEIFNYQLNQDNNNLPVAQQCTVIVDRDRNFKISILTNDNQILDEKQSYHIEQKSSIISPVDNFKLKKDPIADLTNLRRIFQELSNTLYIGSFRNLISAIPILEPLLMERIESRSSYIDYFDIKIGRNFISQWRYFKTGPDRKLNNISVELTEDIKRIFKFNSFEINASEDAQTLKLFINGKVYSLLEVGSGLAQFILVIVNVATRNPSPSYILIDEPELNLHPVLQLDFLTTLGKYASQGVLFATHSIGLARASAEYSYTVRPTVEGSEIQEYEKNPSLVELLGELSYSTYKEFGFDKILLVEGATEIKVMQQFLRKYQKDHDILLLPLGGSGLIKEDSEHELAEIKRISGKIFALIDSERPNADSTLESSRQKFVENCRNLGIECHILERRATENYFTDRAIKAVKGDNFQQLGPYEKLKASTTHGWSKAENWRFAKEMRLDELEGTDLKTFLDHLCDQL